MIITREQAIAAIDNGHATFDGTTTEGGDNGCWIITNQHEGRTDHVVIDDNEPLVGCLACGVLVSPEADAVGCGCHCPNCNATL